VAQCRLLKIALDTVLPADTGDPDDLALMRRMAVYQDVRQRSPQRWSGPTHNWTAVGVVTLNPERDAVARAATSQIQLSGSIREPAFPSRPGSAEAAERNVGDGRSRATRSHAQSALARAGKDGEHRTFSTVSTAAHSSPVGGSHSGKQQLEYKVSRYKLRAATCLTITATAAQNH
jgi:hypothetical protein